MKVLNVLTQIFWKTKTFFKKLEYCFLAETTKIENTSFPFKTALTEANVKTNRMVITKFTYHKEWSFSSNCFIFLEKRKDPPDPPSSVDAHYACFSTDYVYSWDHVCLLTNLVTSWFF